MAEVVSPILGLLIILKDAFKLIFKNINFIAPITFLSLLLPSILILLFSYIYQTLNNYINKIIFSPADSDSSFFPMIIAYISLTFLIEIIFIIAFVKISLISGIATILVSATSDTLSYQDLYSRIKTANSRISSNQFGVSKNRTATGILVSIVLVVVINMVFFYPNPITISIAVVIGVSVSVFQMYVSVPMILSHIVSVVEEKYDGSEALERAKELLLIEQRQVHGFMINLLLNLLFLVILLGFWLRLGTKLWSLNLMESGLFFANFVSLAKIYGCVAYTVLYFRCNGGGIGEFHYSKLSAASDIIP